MMYCPKCGDVIKLAEDGDYICERGQGIMAPMVYQTLAEYYVEHLRVPRDIVFTHNGKPHGIGGQWFCPGCGIQIHESSPGSLVCSMCNRSIIQFIRLLVEHYPHAREVSD